eukprot:TRINITY_DN2329_c0_g1_i1.p2 TRINITY_DN2329_c0_g1~~TRINITY_DN2329_c0_g1_i1.p2  ORF type:complete len:303 (-),score=67.81 TRINITY_DN2329_c0_g1_i1:981-1889(-)
MFPQQQPRVSSFGQESSQMTRVMSQAQMPGVQGDTASSSFGMMGSSQNMVTLPMFEKHTTDLNTQFQGIPPQLAGGFPTGQAVPSFQEGSQSIPPEFLAKMMELQKMQAGYGMEQQQIPGNVMSSTSSGFSEASRMQQGPPQQFMMPPGQPDLGFPPQIASAFPKPGPMEFPIGLPPEHMAKMMMSTPPPQVMPDFGFGGVQEPQMPFPMDMASKSFIDGMGQIGVPPVPFPMNFMPPFLPPQPGMAVFQPEPPRKRLSDGITQHDYGIDPAYMDYNPFMQVPVLLQPPPGTFIGPRIPFNN